MGGSYLGSFGPWLKWHYDRLKQINPQVKVIFTSGYHDPETLARCEREGIEALIPKPFELEEVVSIVRSHVA